MIRAALVALLITAALGAGAALAIELRVVGITSQPAPPSPDECVLGTAVLPCDLGDAP